MVNVPQGTYSIQIAGSGEDQNQTGDLDITDSVVVRGLGDGALIDGGQLDRVFDVLTLGASPVAVTFENLEVFNGRILDECGGGIDVFDDGSQLVTALLDRVILRDNEADTGGGLCNFNFVEIRDSDIRGNSALAFGGGIDNGFAELRMERSTVHGNTAGTDGGGIDNTGGLLLGFNSTISGNSADDGGAIWNGSGGEAILGGMTIVANDAINNVNGIQNTNGTVSLGHVILDNAPGQDCSGGTITSQDYNIESGFSCGLSGAKDLQGTDPALSPLQSVDGSPPVHLPLAGSPAIDIDPDNQCLGILQTDQLGTDRPQDGDADGNAFCDSGSVEIAPPSFECDDFAALSDASGDATADFAALCSTVDQAGASGAVVLLKNGASGADIAAPVAIQSMTPTQVVDAGDVNGNGSSDFAVLGGDDTQKIIVRVHDGGTGALIRSIQYYNPAGSSQYDPVGLVVVASIDGNGSPEVGVMATDTAGGGQIVQFRDAASGAFVINNFFLDTPWAFPTTGPDAFPARFAVVLPDLGGASGPEIGVLAENGATGQIVVMVKDVATNGFIRNVFYLNANWQALGIVGIPDLDGNPGSEIGLLARNKITDQIVLMIKDAGTNTFIVNNFHLGNQWTPRAPAVLDGFDGNSGPETLVLGSNNTTGKWVAQSRDAGTNLFANNTDLLGSNWSIRDVAVVDSIGAGAAQDLAVLARRNGDGVWVIQVVDSQTDVVIRNIFLN